MSEALVAIVTGGAQGLGAAITTVLLKKGYKVCVADIQEDKGKQFVKDQQNLFGAQNVIFAPCDVSQEKDYQNVFETTLKEFQRIDVVVNNAGIVDEHDPRRTININLMGPIIGCRMAFRYMGKSNGGKGGIVITTASIAGLVPYYPLPVYSACKHGLIGLTRSYGDTYHLKRDGIIFTAICPSCTDTPLLETSKTKAVDPEFDAKKMHDPMSAEYVAGAVLKLLEDRINGTTLVITNKRGYQYIGLHEEFKEYTTE